MGILKLSTPGVYVQEISTLPPSVAEVESAIPAFIGYTEKAYKITGGDLHNIPTKISCLDEYILYYGNPQADQGWKDDDKTTSITLDVTDDGNGNYSVTATPVPEKQSKFNLAYAIRHYFDNGGGPCYVVSVGLYVDPDGDPAGTTNQIKDTALITGLKFVEDVDEVTILVIPEAQKLVTSKTEGANITYDCSNYTSVVQQLITQAGSKKDRFALIDPAVITLVEKGTPFGAPETDVNYIRNSTIGPESDRYAAAYYPNLVTSYSRAVDTKFGLSLSKVVAAAGKAVDLATKANKVLRSEVKKAEILEAVQKLSAAVSDAAAIAQKVAADVKAKAIHADETSPAGIANKAAQYVGGQNGLLNNAKSKGVTAVQSLHNEKEETISTETQTAITDFISAVTPSSPAKLSDAGSVTPSPDSSEVPADASGDQHQSVVNADPPPAQQKSVKDFATEAEQAAYNAGWLTTPDQILNLAFNNYKFTGDPSKKPYYEDRAGTKVYFEASNDPRSATIELWKIPNFSLTPLYQKIVAEVSKIRVELPPSAAIAGLYARIDNSKGVWKAPANESLLSVIGPSVPMSDRQQGGLNIDTASGKSINAIRTFPGFGTLVWGARTLNGNDNEWRYINVRRFTIMVEESVKKSSQWAVFEPNTIDTWVKMQAMISNYLLLKWKEGALAGTKPEQAFYVRVGLGSTMTSQDILEGRMNVEIGMAVVRPAEFIVLKFSQLVQQS